MEDKNKKLRMIIKILVVLLVLVSVAFAGYYAYDKISNRGVTRQNIEIKHGETDINDNKVVLNEEDVKKWLENHKLVNLYFILNENNFDINTVDKEYSGFLGFNLLFGGLSENSIENITLDYNTGYNYQYTYSIEYIKNLLNDYFGVGIDKIDIDTMNKSFNELANFSMDNSKFTVKVVATGLDNYNVSEVNKIFLNNNNIFVNYIIKDCTGPNGECTHIGNREVILKKTNDGYNILKAYKVES